MAVGDGRVKRLQAVSVDLKSQEVGQLRDDDGELLELVVVEPQASQGPKLDDFSCVRGTRIESAWLSAQEAVRCSGHTERARTGKVREHVAADIELLEVRNRSLFGCTSRFSDGAARGESRTSPGRRWSALC